MNTKRPNTAAPPAADAPRPATARPLGIADIPGAIHPDEAARRGAGAASNVGAAAGAGSGRPGQGMRPAGGMGGGMAGGYGARQQGGPQSPMAGHGAGMGGGGGDPGARGREILDMLTARLSSGGEAAQRLAGPLNRVAEGYAHLEQEVERLKGELADAEEKIRVLLADGG